ncbi:hypothetical protein [Kaarinaea lacus]
MFRYRRSNHQSVLFLALAFVLIQSYVLYSSTFHVFHHSMPMCPICVAIKSYQGSIVDTTISVLTAVKYFVIDEYIAPQIVRFVKLSYQSRAPPSTLFI